MLTIPLQASDSLADSKIRPYNAGITRHEESLATIILFSDKTKLKPTAADPEGEKNFRTDFGSKIKTLATSANERGLTEGTPKSPGGIVAEINLDGKTPYYGIFNNFSLLNVTESSEEITKLHVNFGTSWSAFFFGEKPKIYQFSGFFVDSKEYPYYQEFIVAYDKYLAGRKVIENKMQTMFMYDGRLVDGLILNLSVSHTAGDQLMKRFNFTVLVKGAYWIRNNYWLNKKNVYIDSDRFSYNKLDNKNRFIEREADMIARTEGVESFESGEQNQADRELQAQKTAEAEEAAYTQREIDRTADTPRVDWNNSADTYEPAMNASG